MHKFLEKLYLWILTRLGRLEEIKAALDRSGGRYLDPEIYARIEGIRLSEAKKALDEGVKHGLLKRRYLYTSSQAPVPLVLNEDDLGKQVRLSDFGIIDEDPARTIFLSPFDVREIYVAAEAD